MNQDQPKKWYSSDFTTEDLIQFLKSAVKNLSDHAQQLIRENEIDGQSFPLFELKDWLEISMPRGPALKLIDLAKKLTAVAATSTPPQPNTPFSPGSPYIYSSHPSTMGSSSSSSSTVSSPAFHAPPANPPSAFSPSNFPAPANYLSSYSSPAPSTNSLLPMQMGLSNGSSANSVNFLPSKYPERNDFEFLEPLRKVAKIDEVAYDPPVQEPMFPDFDFLPDSSSRNGWQSNPPQQVAQKLPVPPEVLQEWIEHHGERESYEKLKDLMRTLKVPKHGSLCPFPNCEEKRNSKTELMKHINATHIQYQVPCSFCDTGFLYESSLTRHIDQKHAQMRNDAIPVYKTKLMVVGYERVGKTSLLDCLFPLTSLILSWADPQKKKRTKFRFKLQGRRLTKALIEKNEILEELILDGTWKFTSGDPTPLSLALFNPASTSSQSLELTFESEEDMSVWVERLRRLLEPSTTHGIDITKVEVDHPTTDSIKPRKLELSLWDFAGQHDYYNSHHYFLQSRTVFLLVWKLNQNPAVGGNGSAGGGMGALEFWFKSLAAHLPLSPNEENGKPLFSVIVVGTHLDDRSVLRDRRAQRSEQVQALARRCGLVAPLQLVEVSNTTLENIPFLQEVVFRAALSHAYMGEKVPALHQIVQTAVENLKRQKEIPLADIQEIYQYCRRDLNQEVDLETEKRALNLLSAWGNCIYFDEPEELSSLVILDPRFLTKQVMAQLFSLDEHLQAKRENGIIHHKDLVHFWAEFKNQNFNQLAPTLMSLMETFEVCFRLQEDQDKERHNGNEQQETDRFFEQMSIIPALLPKNKPVEALSKWWPSDPPFNRKIQVERLIQFNIVPKELVSRLLVRLHRHIQNHTIWRYGVLLLKKETQALVQVDISNNRFVVNLRGPNRQECRSLMDYIVKEVEITTANYPGVQWKHAIRSPHAPEAIISLEEVLKDSQLPRDQRKLMCPEARLPILAEDMLLQAAMEDLVGGEKDHENGSQWWDFNLSGIGFTRDKLVTRIVVEQGHIKETELYDKLHLLFAHFGGDPQQIKTAFAIDNQLLKGNFDGFRKTLTNKHSNSPSLFKKDDWKQLPDARLRKHFLTHLSETISKFRNILGNDGSKCFICPMIHGTTEDAAWKISENGFGNVASLDNGYYGKGIYFTSDFQYASKFPRQAEEKVFLISLLIPGNVYPVTEKPLVMGPKGELIENPDGFFGKACKSGYQSHYILVDKEHEGSGPAQEGTNQNNIADDLIIFHESQVVPIFLVYI